MSATIVYLHGFNSGSASAKAQQLGHERGVHPRDTGMLRARLPLEATG